MSVTGKLMKLLDEARKGKKYEEKDEDMEDLDIHIGFQPNRAVFFPSDMTHAANVSPVKDMRRYTCTLFLWQYTDQWGKKYYYDRDKKCLTIK